MSKSMIFNEEMVKKILSGEKTTAIQIIKRSPSNDDASGYGFWKEHNERDNRWYIKDYTHNCIWWTLEEYISKFVKYHVGNEVYVREPWALCHALDLCTPKRANIEHQSNVQLIWYKADEGNEITENLNLGERMISRGKWRPATHMPQSASRISLKITDVRIERLQNLSVEDIISEGISYDKDIYEMPCNIENAGVTYLKGCFMRYWDSKISKKDNSMYAWAENPWVVVIKFEKNPK